MYPTTSGSATITSWYSSNVASNLQSKIVEHLWNVGLVEEDPDLTIAQNIEQEAAYKWQGKIGLMTTTDYVRASTNSACTNVYSYFGNSVCYKNGSTHNWLSANTSQWTMSLYSFSNASRVWAIWTEGMDFDNVNNSNGVRPVFYLSSDIQLIGNGTNDENIYRIL